MTSAETMQLKSAIHTKRLELVREMNAQVPELIVDEGEHDMIDRIQSMNRMDETAIRLGHMSRVLTQIDTSLDAIAQGSYGLCIECGEPISLQRLKTIPWASRCVSCQELLERGQAEYEEAA